MVRKYIFILGLLLFSTSGYTQKIKVWSMIPFLEGANLDRYLDQYGRTRDEHRLEQIRELIGFMESGVGSYGSLRALRQFNREYEIQMRVSKRGLGATLESDFKAAVEEIYNEYTIYGDKRRLEFYSAYNSIGESLDLDYIIHGLITHSGANRGHVRVSLSLVEVKTGRVKTFVSDRHISQVMKDLALKILVDLQGTKIPSQIEQNLILVTDMNRSEKITRNIAEKTCDVYEGRLPTQKEMVRLLTKNVLQGGLSHFYNREQKYFISTPSGTSFLREMQRTSGAGYDPYGHFVCVANGRMPMEE